MTPDEYTAHQIDWLYRAEADRIAVWRDEESVRDGWHRASCPECEWETSGTENVVKDAVREHVGTHPLGHLLSILSNAVRSGDPGMLLALPQELGAIWAGNEDHPLSEQVRRELDPNDLWGKYYYRTVRADGSVIGEAYGGFLEAMQQLGGVLGAARVERRKSMTAHTSPVGDTEWMVLIEIPQAGPSERHESQ